MSPRFVPKLEGNESFPRQSRFLPTLAQFMPHNWGYQSECAEENQHDVERKEVQQPLDNGTTCNVILDYKDNTSADSDEALTPLKREPLRAETTYLSLSPSLGPRATRGDQIQGEERQPGSRVRNSVRDHLLSLCAASLHCSPLHQSHQTAPLPAPLPTVRVWPPVPLSTSPARALVGSRPPLPPDQWGRWLAWRARVWVLRHVDA